METLQHGLPPLFPAEALLKKRLSNATFRNYLKGFIAASLFCPPVEEIASGSVVQAWCGLLSRQRGRQKDTPLTHFLYFGFSHALLVVTGGNYRLCKSR